MMTRFSGAAGREGMLWVLLGVGLGGCGAEEGAERSVEALERGISDCEESDSVCDAGCTHLVDPDGPADLCVCPGACTNPGCVFGRTLELRPPECPVGGLVVEVGVDRCTECPES